MSGEVTNMAMFAQPGGSERGQRGGYHGQGRGNPQGGGRGRGGGPPGGGGERGNPGDETFVPLPESTKSAVERARKSGVVHPGLEIGKFVSWTKALEADRDGCFKRVCDSLSRLEELAGSWRVRREQVLKALGPRARQIVVRAETPCVLWLGAPTPLELGFCLHFTYGLPYLPGSGLKGLARRAMCMDKGCSADKPVTEVLELFGEGGDKGRAGAVDFMDGIPFEAACLELDVMSPHHQKYYQGNSKIPHDCEDPNPLLFLRIAPGSEFEIALVARSEETAEKTLELAEHYLLLGLRELGVGAKTSSGYGVFALKTADKAISPNKEKAAPEGTRQVVPEATRRFSAKIKTVDGRAGALILQVEGSEETVSIGLDEVRRKAGLSTNKLEMECQRGSRFEVEMRGGTLAAFYLKRG